jgi:hypothetical protein
MMPCRSTCVPIMKPGTSARNTSGMLKASQQPHEAGGLVGAVDEEHAALVHRVVGHDAHRAAVEQARPVTISGRTAA